jgi:hypothetical protein
LSTHVFFLKNYQWPAITNSPFHDPSIRQTAVIDDPRDLNFVPEASEEPLESSTFIPVSPPSVFSTPPIVPVNESVRPVDRSNFTTENIIGDINGPRLSRHNPIAKTAQLSDSDSYIVPRNFNGVVGHPEEQLYMEAMRKEVNGLQAIGANKQPYGKLVSREYALANDIPILETMWVHTKKASVHFFGTHFFGTKHFQNG